MDQTLQPQKAISWKKIGLVVLILILIATNAVLASLFIQEKNRADGFAEKITKQKEVKPEKTPEVLPVQSSQPADKLIDYGNGGKLLKTAADVESLDASSKVKDFLKREVEKANVWNKEVQEKHGGNGIQYEPKIYKIYGDYFAYHSGHDTGAAPRIWGPAIGGEKEQTQEGTVVAKQGEIVGLYGLYTTCSNILKYKIPYELFADYKLVGGMELTIEKCREAERRL